MRIFITAESIPTKFCTYTSCDKFESLSELAQGFWEGGVRNMASPIGF